jgi:hypothetical protein
MTEDQIKHMVDRFLQWRLPEPFQPDGGISFEPYGNKGTPHQYRREPVGTNLFGYTEAEAMVRHMIEGLPQAADPLFLRYDTDGSVARDAASRRARDDAEQKANAELIEQIEDAALERQFYDW